MATQSLIIFIMSWGFFWIDIFFFVFVDNPTFLEEVAIYVRFTLLWTPHFFSDFQKRVIGRRWRRGVTEIYF